MAEAGITLKPVYVGCSYQYQFVFTDTDTGQPLDLSGYTAEMQWRLTTSAETLICSLTTANGRLTIDGLSGKITLALTAVETAALTANVIQWDLILTTTGHVWCPLGGTLTIKQPVTHGD